MGGTSRRGMPALPPFAGAPRLPCYDVDPDEFFPESCRAGSPEVEAAKAICRPCRYVKECRQWAIDTDQPHGIWGATTPDERRPSMPTVANGEVVKAVSRVPPAVLARRFEIARAYLAGTRLRVAEFAAAHGIAKCHLTRAVAILRYAPELEPAVIDGTLPYTETAERATASARQAQAPRCRKEVFAVARGVLGNSTDRRRALMASGLSAGVLDDALTVLRYAPHLVGPVEDGAVRFTSAVRAARAARRVAVAERRTGGSAA